MFGTLSSLIMEKSSRVREGPSSAVSLLGTDLARLTENIQFIFLMVSCISSLTGGILFLLFELGEVAAVGLAVAIIILHFNRKLGTKAKMAESRSLKANDARVAILKQMIESMKCVKFFSWEDSYLEKLMESRKEE